MTTVEKIRASWELKRFEIREYLIHMKFNRKSIEGVINNFIDVMTSIGLACPSTYAIFEKF